MMLVAIERSQFNYLYKQNNLPADMSRICWLGKEALMDLQGTAFEQAVSELDNILPRFEEDHEVILLQYDRKTWDYNAYGHLEFAGITTIIPLTAIGKRLLMGRLNDKMNITEPFFGAVIEVVKHRRTLRLRRLAADKLVHLFNLPHPPSSAVRLIEQAITQSLKPDQWEARGENIFKTLFDYNKTEGFLPEGNVEHLCKVAVLARLHLSQDPGLVPNGPFYKELINRAAVFNRMGLIEAYEEFIRVSLETIPGTQKIREILNDSLDFDMVLIAYSFFAFRKRLNQGENNLAVIERDLQKLKMVNPNAAAIVMYAIGTVFSFEILYESIHALEQAPLITAIDARHAIYKQEKEETSPTPIQPEDKETVPPEESVVGQQPFSSQQSRGTEEKSVDHEPDVASRYLENTAPTPLLEEKGGGIEKVDDSIQKGLPIQLVREFAQKLAKKSKEDFLKVLEAYAGDLRNGVTYEWVSSKLNLEDNGTGKKSRMSKKDIELIKIFFRDNRVAT